MLIMNFSPNIDKAGRILRGAWGVLMLVLAWFTWDHSIIGAVVFLLLALLGFWQARKGWCVARACGLKTKW